MEDTEAPDGGSEGSYESVASEGQIEAASERGRDPLPRIISASHAVQVFQRIRWSDGAHCCRAAPPEKEKTQPKAKKGHEPRKHDPLADLPARILRFDGAMEAWLEEMPLPRDPLHLPPLYRELNDAAIQIRPGAPDLSILSAGNRRATVWYFTLEFLQQLWPLFLSNDGKGQSLWEQALLERGCNIKSTHMAVGEVNCTARPGKQRTQWLKDLFAALQACKWTPDGEARSLLVQRRLSHVSMSIGDCIQVDGDLYIAGLTKFVQVKRSRELLPGMMSSIPGGLDSPEGDAEGHLVDSDSEPSEVAVLVEASQPSSEAAPGKKKKKAAKESREGKDPESNGAEKNGGGGKKAGKGRGKGKKDKEEGEAAAGKGDAGAGKGGKKGKGKGKEKGKAKGAGEGYPGGAEAGGEGKWVAKRSGPADRADRRALREQLQAERKRMSNQV